MPGPLRFLPSSAPGVERPRGQLWWTLEGPDGQLALHILRPSLVEIDDVARCWPAFAPVLISIAKAPNPDQSGHLLRRTPP